MRVPLSWLKDWVKIEVSPEELARRLTSAGLEVTAIERVGGWEGVVIGRISEVLPHPNADRLSLVTVDTGARSFTVVSGAPNLAPGALVPLALPGAQITDGHTGKEIKVKPAKIRGVFSEAVVCSERELGISDDHSTIMTLPSEAPLGKPLAEFLGDAVLDIEVTPNRPDCLSLLGIAWEVAALTEVKVSLPSLAYGEEGPEAPSLVGVEIAAPDLCPRYCAGVVLGVKVAPSPSWLQRRLEAAGMRPINNVVDITNYAMLEYDQPLHTFDLEKVRGRRIIVREARPGEKLVTIDGVERGLEVGMLVIADQEGPLAMAGVMGGRDSEVTEATTSILLESANFLNTSIRRTSALLKLRTEASLRFEKGLSPELPPLGARRAMKLFLEIAGGRAARGIIDIYPGRRERPPILLSRKRVRQVLGADFTIPQVEKVLHSLGFSSKRPGYAEEILVTPPPWRSDIAQADDLVEEVARISGYDSLPSASLGSPIPPQEPHAFLDLKEDLAAFLSGMGMQEVITYSFVGAEGLSRVGAPPGQPLANPLSPEKAYLRTSLLPGLLSVLASNQRLEGEGLRLFEIGRVFFPREGDLPEEREVMAVVMRGERGGLAPFSDRGEMDLFDAKGVVEALFSHLGLEAAFEPGKDAALHPRRSARVIASGLEVGEIGELHPEVARSFDLLPWPVAVIVLDLDKLGSISPRERAFQPLPRFPEVVRDIALVLDEAVPAARVQRLLAGHPLVAGVTLFDLYQGKGIPEGKKSLAFRLVFRSPQRTLTEAEVDEAQAELIERAGQELGAVLRG